MLLALVVGKADASIKLQGFNGTKLLVVRSIGASGAPEGSLIIAVDTVGAGQGDLVAVVAGSSAGTVAGTPCDAAVVAILDHVFVDNREMIPNRRTSI